MLEAFLQSARSEYAKMKLGLDPVKRALTQIGHPEAAYPSILVAGTNGKGSVARMVESVLREAGYRVGLYTSPHLERFNERIQVAGKDVSDEMLEEVLQDFSGRLSAEGLTWFEKATLIAFEVFRREKIDLAVLEVGLGGRLDATNVVDPLVSAIVSIGKDHTEILGDSLFDIAREKAGVMRKGKPVVLGFMPPEVRNFLQKAARQMGAAPVCPKWPEVVGESFSYANYSELGLGLRGGHQIGNAAVAIEVLEALRDAGFEWTEPQLAMGLRAARNPGRLEWFSCGGKRLLLDGAHNAEAWRALLEYLHEKKEKPPSVLVFGMMREKDARAALQLLKPFQTHWIFTELPLERSLKVADFEKLAAAAGLSAEFFTDSRRALDHALERAGEGEWVLATGSLYLAAELRRHLRASGAVPEAS